MGYWSQNEQGASFADAENGEDMIWGDQPADVVDDALNRIVAVFMQDVGRVPSVSEVRAGIEFSLARLDEDLPTVPSQVRQLSANEAEVVRQHISEALRHDQPSFTPRERTAWQHLKGVMAAHKPEPVAVPDNAADLIEGDEKPF